MNWKNISLTISLFFLSVLLPLEIRNKLIAQEIDENVTLEEVTENTEKLIGKVVSIRGEIEDLDSNSAFIVSNEEGLGELFGEEKVLVVNITNEPIILPKKDTKIQIIGQVAEFILTNIQREYGLDLDPELYAEYETKPAILANSIALSPEPGEVTQDPKVYYNRRVAIKGEVEEILNSNTFTLDEDRLIGGSNLIVVNLTNKPLPTKNEEVVITGVIRPFVKTDLEQEYDLDWDLEVQEKIEAEYSELPILIVDRIYPSVKQ